MCCAGVSLTIQSIQSVYRSRIAWTFRAQPSPTSTNEATRMEQNENKKALGYVGWDGSAATSERVLLRASFSKRHLVERNHYVHIQDPEGERTGFLGRVIAGPFFHRSGAPTIGGLTAGTSLEGYLLVELEIQGELVGGRPRSTNSRPAPDSPVYALSPEEIAALNGFMGDMLLGSVAGQDEVKVHLQSKNKGVLPRNIGIFGTVGAGKSNTTQVLIEEAARTGWAVIVIDVEGEYVAMDQPSEGELTDRLLWFGKRPEGLPDFHVFRPACCPCSREDAEPFTLRLSDFDSSIIAEILQVALPERNALLDCIETLQNRARRKMPTTDNQKYETLLDASPESQSPFTLHTLRERSNERGSRSTELIDYSGLTAKLSWLLEAEAFDLPAVRSLDMPQMMTPGRVTVVDVSVASDIIRNLTTADLLAKSFALKMLREDTPPTLLVIEEAHSFVSRDREQTMQATMQMLQNVIRRGRKRWLAMAFVSQQPGHLPPEIFELCNTRLVHALRSTHNLEALKVTSGEVNSDLWARCPLLGPGQAILSSPQLSQSVILSVRPAASRRMFTR